ncbi:MAG: hypothetical protein AAGA60_29220 [Cyanobacteria bacterium P01_E01_bin.42]
MNYSRLAIWRDRLLELQSRETLTRVELGEIEDLKNAIAIVESSRQAIALHGETVEGNAERH